MYMHIILLSAEIYSNVNLLFWWYFLRCFDMHYNETELYISCNFLTRYQRRILAMCRAGILPLEVERGHWRSIPRNERICRQCDMNCIEDLEHFITVCPKYTEKRSELKCSIEQLMSINNYDMNLEIMFNNSKIIKTVANYVINTLKMRNV